jgi:hypothetical protein
MNIRESVQIPGNSNGRYARLARKAVGIPQMQ